MTTKMNIVLIVNPLSGGRKGKSVLESIESALELKGIAADLRLSRYAGHVEGLLGELALEKYDAIVSMGGDGTNFQVLNGLLKRTDAAKIPPLGIIPTGRGNSFAKDLNIHSVADGIDALVSGPPKPVDVLSFSQDGERHYFVNLAGFGFVTDVAETAVRFKVLGDLSYVVGVLWQTIGLKWHDMVLEVDGRVIREKNCFVEFCNSRYTGGKMLMAPEAKIDDGLFDIVIVAPLSRWTLMATFPKIFKGTHGQHPAVTVIRAKRAKVVATPPKTLLPDGEILGKTPTEINIHPGMVRYFHLNYV